MHPKPDRNGSLAVRAAGVADLPAIAALASRIWREHYPGIISHEQIEYMLARNYDPAALEKQMTEGQRLLMACDENTAAAGFIAYELLKAEPGVCMIHKLYVDAPWRGRGASRLLIAAACREAGPAAQRLRLRVNRRNILAVNAYFALGFTIAALADEAIGGGFMMNDFVMERRA